MSGDGTIDLANAIVGLQRNGEAREIEHSPGPPPRIDGLTIGAPLMTREPPHSGEMHPDGDEILFLISGKVTVLIEDQDPAREVELAPGQAVIVPRGVWHRVRLNQPIRSCMSPRVLAESTDRQRPEQRSA